MCIYLITNLINDKKYVGQTIYKNPNQRWSKHKYDTKRDSFCSIHMAMRKYRIENFKFEVIDESANNIDELNDLEEFYISFYDTFKGHGYNSTSGGDGYTFSDETKRKMSINRTGNLNPFYKLKHSDETKRKISEANKNKKVSTETRQKLSKANTGRKHSEEHKQKIKRSGKLNGMYGVTHSEESKRKMSESSKGKFGILHHNSKKVIQINKDTGEEIACWFSCADVQRELNINGSMISAVCKGKRNQTGGYKWKYA